MMKVTKKRIFGSWLIVFVILLGLPAIDALVDASSASVESSIQESIFEENEIILNKMTEEMNQLLIQIEDIHRRGGLPAIDLPLGIRIDTFDLLSGFMNGIDIPLLVNIGGIGRLNDALFDNYTYSTILSGNLRFSDGIMNGSSTVNNDSLPPQSLDAQIAAQEYLLYVTDAIVGALRLILLMDMEENDVDIADMLAGARNFLAFNMDDFNQRREVMYDHFGRESVTMGSLRSVTRNVSDVVSSVDGEGYSLLIDLRNFLLGGQENVNILIDVLEYTGRVVNGEIIEKYHYIDFASTDDSTDQLFDYLIADATEARYILSQFDNLTEPFVTLLNQEEGGIVALIFSQIPEHLEFLTYEAIADIDSIQGILEYLDTAIIALEEMRLGVQELDLDQGRRFVTEVLSGEITNKYLDLRDARGLQIGTLLRYLVDDIESAIVVLEIADLIDQEFAHLLGDRYLSDLVTEYIIVTLPYIIDAELAPLIAAFENWDMDDLDIDDWDVGETAIEVIAPVILSFDISETIDNLRLISDALTYLIPMGEEIERITY